MSAPHEALAAWVTACNKRGRGSFVASAVSEDICLERIGFGRRAGELMETMRGIDAVTEWLRITPKQVTFSLDGDTTIDDSGVHSVRYKVEAGDFTGGGRWTFRLREGLISWLRHDPDSFDDAIDEIPREQRHTHHDH